MISVDTTLTAKPAAINSIIKTIIDGDFDNAIGYLDLDIVDGKLRAQIIADIDSQTFWMLVGNRDETSVIASGGAVGELVAAGSEFNDVYHINFAPTERMSSRISDVTWNDMAVDVEKLSWII